MTTSRRGFLKGLGATLAAIGGTASTSAALQQISGVAGIDTTPGSGGRAGRVAIGHDELEMLVAEHLNERIAKRLEFTAYDVTVSLRAAHPDINIPHAVVRGVVHRRMQPWIANQFYGWRHLSFPTGMACCYVPLR